MGSSPWQSSPQPTSRPSFTPSGGGSIPSSPLAKQSAYTAESPEGTEGDSSDQDTRVRRNVEENTQPSRSGAIRTSQTNGNAQQSSDYMQSPPLMQQPPQPQPQQQARQPQSQQQRGGPNRYHGGANRNVTRQNLPQYKLQAKVTSLERTGRKDPVLRFDVHVSLCYSTSISKSWLSCTADKSSQVPYHSISRCSTYPFRVL